MSRFDITKTKVAVERLIETTENPRHLLTVEQAGKLLDPLIKPLPEHNPYTA